MNRASNMDEAIQTALYNSQNIKRVDAKASTLNFSSF
ncbi:hypothetical protein GGC03_03945 [Vibrio sp. THAF191c]|nr:hypothetical protein FIU99_03945 [Vibrio sp. THAF64]QGM33468.1 hypothetical protein GGC04_03950 [Vibrio sp. THAF191d]QGN68970.1 hypothetical protein GGC03_03945 [Vibrio sp. THAF191c]